MSKGRFQAWFDKNVWNTERRFNLEDPNQVIDGFTVGEILGGQQRSKSGATITPDSALSISAVYRCVAILSGIISYLPKKVYRDENGARVEATDHTSYQLFKRRMHPYYTSAKFFESAVIHMLLRGNHLAQILYTKNEISGFKLLDPTKLKSITEGYSGRLWYEFTDISNPISSEYIIHVPNLGENPIKGKGTIEYAREDLGLETARRDTGAGFWRDGGRAEGLIIPQQKITTTQAAELKSSFTQKKKEGGTVVSPFGVTYTPLSMTPADQEFIMSGNFSVATICRWFGVPLDKLSELSRATFSNIEHQAIAFLQDTIAPIVNKFENEYTTKCYTLDREMNMYFEMNMDAYQRADSQAQAELMRSEVQNAGLTPNEWRKMKNRPALEGGDDAYLQLNMAPLKDLEAIQTKPKPAPGTQRKAELIKNVRELVELIEIDGRSNGNGSH